MALNTRYSAIEPTRDDIDALTGAAVLEFGSPTCGYCFAAQPAIAAAFAGHTDVAHFKIADGRGRQLGRTFGVKLWPTLIFLSQGKEVSRLVRPGEAAPIRDALRSIHPPAVE